MTDYFREDEDERLRHIRAEILKYKSTELMNDRERARFLGLPEGCRIRQDARILHPENLVCGADVWIGERAVLDASGGLEIGDNTQIGVGVMVFTHTSHLQALSGETGKSRDGIVRRPTKIGRNCFIAGPSVIGPGITIGDRVIISPFSLITEDLDGGAVVNHQHEQLKLERRVDRLERLVAELRDSGA